MELTTAAMSQPLKRRAAAPSDKSCTAVSTSSFPSSYRYPLCVKCSSLRNAEPSRAILGTGRRSATGLNEGRKFRVGGRGGAHFGEGLGIRLGYGVRWTASTWLDNSAQVEADVPLAEAWALWSDQENVVNWMPWIASVKVLEDKPNMSKWTLRYEAFGQKFEFSWLARLLKPIHHQKIHWRSVDGLPNRGAVRFYPRGATSCGVQLIISYEVPDILAPFASGVVPLVENILQQDLNRFAKYAKSQSESSKISRT